MDSSAINKLIRAEIWPLLRQQGFTKFEARTAFQYAGPFVNVVNFQSFNEQLASGVGCTTYSLALNLGVFVSGGRSPLIKRDRQGTLLPREYECDFRRALEKRRSIDGFSRPDVFYIDPDGNTVGPCFREIACLLTTEAPQWFARHNDLGRLIEAMTPQTDAEGGPFPEVRFAGRGSYAWNGVLARLLLLRHEAAANEETARDVVRVIGFMASASQGFGCGWDGPFDEDRHALWIRNLWDRLGGFAPTPGHHGITRTGGAPLPSPTWAPACASETVVAIPNKPDCRRDLWPHLRAIGFHEFTDRLAHRVAGDRVDVVEVRPTDRAVQRARGLPSGSFAVGVGIFWSQLRREGMYRKNREGEPRPLVRECAISNWLAPATPRWERGRACFHAMETSACEIVTGVEDWLSAFHAAEVILSMLEWPEWELFWHFPLLRLAGSRGTAHHFAIQAALAAEMGQAAEVRRLLESARRAVETNTPEHVRGQFRSWIEDVSARLH